MPRTGTPGRPELPTGTVTFLRTDIEGSMTLVRELGAGYDRLQAEHHALMRSVMSAHDGVEVGTEGDAFFVVFPDAGQAVRAAVAIQRSIAFTAWAPTGTMRVLEPLPVTRTSPDLASTAPRSRPVSSETRRPHE